MSSGKSLPRINILNDPNALNPNRVSFNQIPLNEIRQATTRSQQMLDPEKIKKQEFLASLKEQIAIKEERKRLDKLKQMQDDRRIIQEESDYQYFGKAGAGGIKKDYLGRTIASRKADTEAISNMYGNEAYNNGPIEKIVEIEMPDFNTSRELVNLRQYHKNQLREEMERQALLSSRLKEEQRRRELMEQKLEEQKIMREREEIRLQYLKEQEEAKNRFLSLQNKEAREVVVQSRKQNRRGIIIKKVVDDDDKDVVVYKTHVKLQANLEPAPKEGDVPAEEFVEKLPARIKEQIGNTIGGELLKLKSEMQLEESRVMDNILQLKVYAALIKFIARYKRCK